jgi:hypothetical protein
VFRGGCTLEAASEVCQEARALDFLQQLRENSLLLADESGVRTSLPQHPTPNP